ncbi:MAG TPA: SIS domain-containing protein [Bryobacteraceae bacterium]
MGGVADRLLSRNRLYEAFFDREADRLARSSEAMSARFLEGGRLLAIGRGVYATDAQHVSVEFVHPVIVGKRALPALDLSAVTGSGLAALMHPEDIVMGFGPPGGDPEVHDILADARRRGAMTFALPGRDGDYSVECFSADPFQHQEMIEILYHTLWETVHVFFERRELGSGAGDAQFLYPFLGGEKQQVAGVLQEVAASIRMKVADDARLRERVAQDEAPIASAAAALVACIRAGGKLLIFGNGGSATDANDWALDCVCPPPGMRAVPALSLAAEPAVLTALSNDVGTDVIFLRQIIAHGRPGDAAIAISTSGGSRNILAALEEARRRGLKTFALLGYDGGEVVRRGLADFPIVVRSDYIPRIQEVQASIYHVIRELIEEIPGG